jgi:FkbM family methyltransferase
LNLAEFGDRAVISDKAVWRSDVQVSSLSFWPSSDPLNAGGGTVIWETDGAPVEAVAFDDVVASLVQRHQRRIDLLKIDCEGSEFPILLTSRRLGDIAQIVGEYHELRATPPTHARVPGIEQFRLEDLTDALGRQGFLVEHEKQAEGTFGALGLFFARRVHDK